MQGGRYWPSNGAIVTLANALNKTLEYKVNETLEYKVNETLECNLKIVSPQNLLSKLLCTADAGSGHDNHCYVDDTCLLLLFQNFPRTQETKKKCKSLKSFCFPGVTTACDMGAVQDSADAWDTLEKVYVPAADEGTLPMRLMAMVPLPTWSAPKC